MTIVTVPSGSFTPGAQATLDFAAGIINAAWDQGNVKSDAFQVSVSNALSAINAGTVHITADVAPTTGVTEPSITIADTSASDVLTTFTTKYLELVALLADKFTAFRTTYFPDEATTFGLAEDWVQAAINNPDYAIPPSVAAQLLTDDKNRAYAEAAVATDAVLATFAARRFPLPPGAAAGAALQINQKAQDVIADSGRKLMLASIEQMKFAIDKAMAMRQEAMNSAIAYIQALASGPAMASQVVGTGYDAQSKMVSAAASYYGARTDAARVVRQAEQFNVTTKLTKDEKNQAVDMQSVEERVKALMSEAATLGQMASSLFNNVHASSGTSYGVNGT